MALKACRECAKEVSTEAPTCPHCGAAGPTDQGKETGPPCPQCGSSNTLRIGPGTVAGTLLVGGSCLLWIPVVGWVLAPLFLLGALFAGLGALVPSGQVRFQCRSCKRWFKKAKAELPPTARKPVNWGLLFLLAFSAVLIFFLIRS